MRDTYYVKPKHITRNNFHVESSPMLSTILKRLISSVISFFIFTAILFFGVNIFAPGDFADTLALQLDLAERTALKEELGLNLSLTQQYFIWIRSLMQGNLGRQFSFRGAGVEVADLIASTLPATLLVFVAGAILAFLFGEWLGKALAWNRRRWISTPSIFASIVAYTSFPPWLAFLFGYILVDRLGLLPQSGTATLTQNRIWRDAPYTPSTVMTRMLLTLILVIIALALTRWIARRFLRFRLPISVTTILTLIITFLLWQTTGLGPYINTILKAALIPFIVFTLLAFGDTFLIMRSAMIDSEFETYVQLARAKGLPEWRIRDDHAGRNAILPVLTRFVVSFPYLLTAIVIVENATGWDGIGGLLFNAIYSQNTYVYMGVMVIVGLITLIARLVLDVLYVILDPRIRLQSSSL